MVVRAVLRVRFFWMCLWVASCSAAPPAPAHPTPPAAVHETASVAIKEPPGPVRHVVVVTIDGLRPDSYLNPERYGLEIPNLRRLVAEGASSDGALSVFPTLTYPAHTSIASGSLPGRHGVVTNYSFDPLEQNQNAWRWYDQDVKTPRLWDVARAAGYRTAVFDWPVTVGEAATLHVPEFWRARVPEDLKLIDALSTPGLLASVSQVYPSFSAGFIPQDVSDEAGTDLASYALRTVQPHVLFFHIWQVDAAQHKYGLDTEPVRAAIENADRQLGRLLEDLERTGMASTTVLAVVSDHGFANVTRCVNPSYLLRQAGLLKFDEKGRVEDWEAAVLSASGSAYVYLKRPDDAALAASTLRVFTEAQQTGTSGIARILSRQEIAALGGDPAAFIALEAELGTYFSQGRDSYDTPPANRAAHGYDPYRPEMRASLILHGATVPQGKLVDARLIDVAPTLASMLGLSLGATDGTVLRIQSGTSLRALP